MQIELSNQGRVEVDEESKDELLPSTPQTNQNVPMSPPSLPPPSPSSSTTHPSTHPQPSQLALEPAAASNESSIASQIAQLFSLVGQLKEENKAQASSVEELSRTVARLSSENSSLSSEVAILKQSNEDQHKLNGDLARSSIPGGFWVWEGSEGGLEGRGGRWVWSSEKYKVLPPPNVASGPPTSLLSLPVELLSLVLDLLETKEHLVLSLVSFKLLELSSRCFYGDNFFLDPVQACDFVESRVFQSSPKSERITPLLLPSTKVHLYGSSTDAAFQDLVELASALPSPPSSLRVEIVSLEISDINELTPWTGLIRFVNPTEFHLWIGDDDNLSIPPTVRFVPLDFVASFTSLWTRLMCFYSLGHDSVLLLEGTESTSAFEECLRRCYPSLVLCGDLWRWMLDGTHRRERVPLEEIASFLARPFASYGEEELVGFYLVMKKRREKARVGEEGVGSAEGAVVQ